MPLENLFSALKAACSVFVNAVASSSHELGVRKHNDSPKRPSLHRTSGESGIGQMVTFSHVVLVESSSYNESSKWSGTIARLAHISNS
jgi:hypothetical protein